MVSNNFFFLHSAFVSNISTKNTSFKSYHVRLANSAYKFRFGTSEQSYGFLRTEQNLR